MNLASKSSSDHQVHCGCCAPPRQIYRRAQGRLLDSIHHEDDDSDAELPVSMAARQRAARA